MDLVLQPIGPTKSRLLKQVKILFITNELGYRGTPRFLTNCALLAQNAGHDTMAWGIEEGGDAAERCHHAGIRSLVGEDKLVNATSFSPDLIHIHRAGWPSKRNNRILSALKATKPCRVLETSVFGAVDFSSHALIDLHAHISQWDLWRWRQWLWPLHQPGILLPYCIDTQAFQPVSSNFRAEHHIPPNAFLIGRIGKTNWHILGDVLLRVMRKCPDIWFVTVNDYSAETNERSVFQSFSNRIVTIPRLSTTKELCKFYSACDVTVNFSFIGESFGYGIAESMSCGTPVITLSTPRNDNAQIELAAFEFGGFPIDNASTAAIVIEELANNRAALSSARGKCRDSIERRYSTHIIGPQILKAYDLLNSTTFRGKMLEHLFVENGFTANISRQQISNQLRAVRGSPPSHFELLKMRLAYSLPNTFRILLKERRISSAIES